MEYMILKSMLLTSEQTANMFGKLDQFLFGLGKVSMRETTKE